MKNVHFWLFRGGGTGGPSIIRPGPSCCPAILSPISIYIWKQSGKDFLSYCESNEVSVDTVADVAVV